MIAIIQKMVCIGAMKRSTLGVAPDGSCNPANIACRTLFDILSAKTANEIERLRRAPVVTRVADIPEATPLLVTGAELMIELMFGATNIPPPAPTIIMRSARVKFHIHEAADHQQTSSHQCYINERVSRQCAKSETD